ncbi:hypothetical protein [Spirosoma pollinicola]|uniref:Uncharacterized protein n=1 Tax=Spirosoma pollinicola TaxID=2057025 RepID=A0A2K8YTJ4_9BACT|nr:hypothetical protein [Spirosoma pollinicola]AUD00955.1 hypothetical protein CWM47_03460 [Spirosoma pollinicola]
MNTKNPYADKDGGPKAGMLAQWDAWETEAEQKRRESLTPQQRQAEDVSRRSIKDRMQSESEFR